MRNDKVHKLKMFNIEFRKDRSKPFGYNHQDSKISRSDQYRKHVGMLEDEEFYYWYRITFGQKLNTNRIGDKCGQNKMF